MELSVFHAAIYGVVQGLTEYLPVSSSAHLLLLPHFLGISDPGTAFDVWTHVGTLGATLWYFRADWGRVFQGGYLVVNQGLRGKKAWPELSGENDGSSFAPYLVVATLPAVVVGFFLHKLVETELRSPLITVFTLSIGGVFLFIADWRANRMTEQALLEGRRGDDSLSPKFSYGKAFKIGLFQCLSLIPGFSRSGSTMMGARFLGLYRSQAARFSFLLSGPITAGAVIIEMKPVLASLKSGDLSVTLLVVAVLSSFLSGLLAIGLLLKFVQKVGFLPFTVYRLLLAAIVWWKII